MREKLSAVLEKYAIPPASIIGKRKQSNKSDVMLSYVGHAEITRILILEDPDWNWRPVAFENGRPVISVNGNTATMWGYLTLHGKEILGVGSCDISKNDVEKELIGDFLRNAAMRFGIGLSLWSKQEWEGVGVLPPEKPKMPQEKADTIREKLKILDGYGGKDETKICQGYSAKDAKKYASIEELPDEYADRIISALSSLISEKQKGK